ncbi:DEKNAAC103948 [Brettanomyces naardenensis]|uniref:DEKNAAC103948 n=1 Tax=Brettanomyces naardenensis TaxID=13370 RepID=A0A448YPM6_BRENA|nr:DEKNAAC103948 [Brettanomyces naardenensis]
MKSYHVPVTVIRSNNVYGYNQYEEKLIPMVISSLSNDKAVTIQGDGHNKRRYLFIDDFTEAVLTIWKKGEAYEIYNVGSEDEKSNNEIVEMIIDVWGEQNGKKDVNITYVKDREFNDERYEVDFEKVRRLGWVAKVGLREGLSRVVRGHRGSTEVPGPLLK